MPGQLARHEGATSGRTAGLPPEPRDRHDRVLMLAEHRLEVGGPVGETRRGLPEDRDQALGRVAHALRADPRLMQLGIGRARAELAADPLEMAPGSFHQRPHRVPRMRGDDVGEDGRLARGRRPTRSTSAR